jgi:hypothetical protein
MTVINGGQIVNDLYRREQYSSLLTIDIFDLQRHSQAY